MDSVLPILIAGSIASGIVAIGFTALVVFQQKQPSVKDQ